MKIAISGKGGVGKTTLAGCLARFWADKGKTVLAVDADPDSNLHSALGVSSEVAASITPLAQMKDLVAERTGAQPGSFGGMFRLNPKVDDIPDEFGVQHGNIKLLVLGSVPMGGGGCLCPEGTLLRVLMRHMIVQRDEAVIVDMEAGLEHLARGSTKSMDAMIIVVEPGQRAVQTAHQIKRLAFDLGIEKVFVVGNKVVDDADRSLIESGVSPLPVLGYLSSREAVREADRKGVSPYDLDDGLIQEVSAIGDKLAEIFRAGATSGES